MHLRAGGLNTSSFTSVLTPSRSYRPPLQIVSVSELASLAAASTTGRRRTGSGGSFTVVVALPSCVSVTHHRRDNPLPVGR